MHWHNTSQSIMKLSYSEESIERAEGSTEMPLSAMCDSINVGRPNHPSLEEVHERSTTMQCHVSTTVTLDMADTYADRWLSCRANDHGTDSGRL